ncbi:MAG TPA: GNAT family N-acetyltransferase [Solirubrobacterales bacterium]|nr:GNAT family N-acetyltransferase [Solirubrobacterales bacterium]
MLTPHRNPHLNLIDSSRQLFELDPGAEIESGAGWLLGAGRSPHPVISNAAFRADDGLDPGEFLERARDFFAARNRGFAVWARSEAEEDRDLIAAAEQAGLKQVYEMPEMVLGDRVEDRPPPDGVELSRVASSAEADDYWRVAASAYTSIGFPPEVFAFYENHGGLTTDNAAAYVARLDGQPAGIAMTIVSHGVAGIYWVGCTEAARGRGLGWTVTAAAVNAGLEMGAETASLQASPMGESLYRQMGFETIFDYRLLMWSPPGGNR